MNQEGTIVGICGGSLIQKLFSIEITHGKLKCRYAKSTYGLLENALDTIPR